MPLTNDFKIKNNLNTLGKILSGGVDIATIFSPSNTSWTLSATNGTFGVAGGDTVQFQGSNGVDVRVATGTDTVRISGIDATTSVKGVASFNSASFAVTNGDVTIKSSGVSNAQLSGSITDDKLSTITTAGKVANSATTATSSNTANAIVARGASGEFSSGSITSSGTVEAVTVNATTGFKLNNGATSGNFLRGDGTNFVSSAIQVSDVPTLNQNTTGSAATLTTTRTLWGQNFNGGANVTGNLTSVGDITGTGAITIATGSSNQDITLSTSGTGEVNIAKVDIDGGRIDGTPIGLTTPASGVFTGVTVTGNVSIDGNLFVSGSATQIDTANLIVSDPIIFLGEGNLADTVDIGFTAAYNHGSTPPRHTGLIRDDVTKKWTLFSNLSTEILSAVQIPLDNPSVQIDTLRANIEGTLTGNVSGTALRANQFTTARIISATGDISYSSGSFDGSANVTGTATIANDAVTTVKILNNNVTYAKIQNVSATDRILGRSSSGAGVIEEITCTVAGRALLDDADAAAQRTTLGVGTTDSVTFGEVIVNNGTRSVLNDVYNTTVTSTNVATLATFATASYNSTKYTVQIKQGTTRRAALEIIATKDNGTWEGTVYGIIDQGNIFSNVEISVTGSTVDLVFTFNGNANYTVAAYAQAISD